MIIIRHHIEQNEKDIINPIEMTRKDAKAITEMTGKDDSQPISQPKE